MFRGPYVQDQDDDEDEVILKEALPEVLVEEELTEAKFELSKRETVHLEEAEKAQSCG